MPELVLDVGHGFPLLEQERGEALPQIVEIARRIGVPVMADSGNGFGPAHKVWRCVEEFEAAGVAGIHIEDQEFGKHMGGEMRLLGAELMADKVRAATAARKDPDFVIIARSDSIWANGDLDEGIRRAGTSTPKREPTW